MIKNAVILAAGFGRRLNPLTLNCPKPLLKIGNETLLSNTIKFLEEYKIVSGNDDGTFGVIADSGELYVIKSQNLDYETITSFSLGVTVSDGTKTSAEETVTVQLVDDPNPFVVNNFTVQVYSDSGKSSQYGEDSDDIIISSAASSSDYIYSIESGNDKDLFSLDSSTGKLTLNTAPDFSNAKKLPVL